MTTLQRLLIFCAHSDDQVFGAGGYMANLAKQGTEVRTIICSFGEMSHPYLNEPEIRHTRVLESHKADKMLGGSGVVFLGLREGNFRTDFEERGLLANMVSQITDFNPDRILTHSSDDPLPDHRAVHDILFGIYDEAKLTCEVYTFDVWNLFNLTKRKNPKLIVDISKTFKKKVDALELFRSQRMAMIMLLWSVYVKAFLWGRKRGCKYAEVYYKVR